MRRFVVFIALVVLTTSCSVFAKDVQEVKSLESFASVVVKSSYEVELFHSSQYKIEIETSRKLLESLIVEVIDGVLVLDMKPNSIFRSPRDIEVRVFAPVYEKVSLMKAVELSSEGRFEQDRLTLSSEGASNIELDMDIDSLFIEVRDASDLELCGLVDFAKINLKGAVNLDAEDLTAKSLRLVCKGTVNGKVNVTDSFDVSAEGVCNITYKGSPELKKDIKGLAVLKQK